MNTKSLFATATAVMLVAACGKTPSSPTPSGQEQAPEKIPINISISPVSKATDTAYESGDKVGLYVVNSGSALSNTGNHADNVAFTFTGSAWNGAADLYWKDQSTAASFFCYYPYVASISNVKEIPFAVKTDQSTLENYKASELLWGQKSNVTPTSDVVEITTTHRMSNILVYVLPGNGYTAETIWQEGVQVTINNLKVNAVLDAENGTATASGTPADIVPYLEADHFRALVPPQAIDNQTLISLKVGSYSFSIKETIAFKSNTQHKVSLTVNKISEGINIGIGDWETDDTDYGGTVN
ncbi:MAG: fimbrillin family protein [Bacteroidales bacterium]|nr:fimbrillin family protein [Bacteroidales bacterium]